VNRQIRILGVFLLLLFAVLFLQLNNLQVLQASKLANAPGNTRNNTDRFSKPRGYIQTSDGTIVARSVPTSGSYKYLREYPQGPLFADVTGYFSLIYGTDGVERTYNSYLESHTAPITRIQDILANRTVTDNVTLTLSSRLQQVAASQLGSDVGAIVALDPSSGAVLAMYSNPSYDPNPLASHDARVEQTGWNLNQLNPAQPMLARAYRRSYAPGSTFKVVTASAVLDHDPSLASQSVPTVSSITLPNSTRTLSNFGGETCGGMLPELLTVSCDTGFATLGLELGAQNLSAEAQSFGFNQVPPLDLPNVAASNFPPPSAFAQDQPGLAYSAIGQQDVSATALQMALVAGAIADRGVIMKPHVMSQIRDSQGRLVRSWKPSPWLTATSPQTAGSVGQMMVSVVQSGTATNVALPGVQVAAKTGTAQTSQSAGSNNWLIAFAPASAPTVAVAVVVPAQAGVPLDSTGSTVAGPMARAMLAAALGKP
jgi:peptidoglycan glycosyltransferase